MTLELVRVDDRLIHGQVIVGWGHLLRPETILLVDDEIAANEWEMDLYRMGVPDAMEISFLTVEDAAARMESFANSAERVIVVLGSVDSLARLCDKTSAVRKVNLGGVHFSSERIERLPYVFLSDEEMYRLGTLEQAGIEIVAQDVPTSSAVPFAGLK